MFSCVVQNIIYLQKGKKIMRERQEKKVAFSNLTKRPDLTDGNPKFEIAKQRKIVEVRGDVSGVGEDSHG